MDAQKITDSLLRVYDKAAEAERAAVVAFVRKEASEFDARDRYSQGRVLRFVADAIESRQHLSGDRER